MAISEEAYKAQGSTNTLMNEEYAIVQCSTGQCQGPVSCTPTGNITHGNTKILVHSNRNQDQSVNVDHAMTYIAYKQISKQANKESNNF